MTCNNQLCLTQRHSFTSSCLNSSNSLFICLKHKSINKLQTLLNLKHPWGSSQKNMWYKQRGIIFFNGTKWTIFHQISQWWWVLCCYPSDWGSPVESQWQCVTGGSEGGASDTVAQREVDEGPYYGQKLMYGYPGTWSATRRIVLSAKKKRMTCYLDEWAQHNILILRMSRSKIWFPGHSTGVEWVQSTAESDTQYSKLL